jgi:hypothetical protein
MFLMRVTIGHASLWLKGLRMLDILVGAAAKWGVGLLLGASGGYAIGEYRRRRHLAQLAAGKWDTSVEFVRAFCHKEGDKIHFHAAPIGSFPIATFFGSQEVKGLLTANSQATGHTQSVVPMPGQLGSYVLRELQGMLAHCTQGSGPIEDWIMCPIYPTYLGLKIHTPGVILIRPKDLRLFTNFAAVKDFQVLYSDRGAFILTALELRQKVEQQRTLFLGRKAQGHSTLHLEEFFTVRARLSIEPYEPNPEDVRAGVARDWKSVSWERYAQDLEALGYQT